MRIHKQYSISFEREGVKDDNHVELYFHTNVPDSTDEVEAVQEFLHRALLPPELIDLSRGNGGALLIKNMSAESFKAWLEPVLQEKEIDPFVDFTEAELQRLTDELLRAYASAISEYPWRAVARFVLEQRAEWLRTGFTDPEIRQIKAASKDRDAYLFRRLLKLMGLHHD